MKPRIVYWNNIPSPYFVGRMNALVQRGNLDLSVWFNQRREEDRSWIIDENEWMFPFAFNDSKVSAGFFREMIRNKPDLLVSLYNTPKFISGNLLAKILGIRTAYRVLPTYDAWVARSRFKEASKRLMFRLVDGVKVPGKDGSMVALKYGVPPNRIFKVTQSIDVEHFATARSMSMAERNRFRDALGVHGCVFIYVGRLWEGKGLNYLLEAYKRMLPNTSDVSLLIVGDGVDETRYREMARGVQGVKFAGFIQERDLPEYYAVADVMVFPTLGDPYGLVVEEAMAAGLPVICTEAAGDIRLRLPEAIAGFIVPPKSTDLLFERMLFLASNLEERLRMGRQASDLAITRNHDRYAEDFEHFVESLLAIPKRKLEAKSNGL
ncbi:MAG: hypothetical protein COW19_02540 [Zetaproteobacteria bacterium CG12_big_fil_rev_8_21_14_0_65_55_1124]|nr:MAG: hypothetical protein COT53_04045 [Zetaproteobacteria bacterium CG08_land_8_20_14_0_20_55_17]PIW43470.1 MAG: hypothetical protein COW19_02540 [Zetaproteobacteria bacterium CG12_big_fil_rev_8_21_14_0_65_55_1124]PIY54101.1 MAG: hypothetical protein COZ01_01320 [Zetaproteobacteria bacterium CG_4_10_14_0_8_um_filter_55_43]PIZ39094.1 MAG: hypothetical protein COY36_03800 [Zetaproteobacteria bacterium CG_4_10_14_0_2_um_filter_55_20]PJB81507.1 MAG: hypothetical protein CO089_04025 [Zetaproteoba